MSETLEQARQWLRDQVEDGAVCPCCSQFAKVYRRKITGSIAAVLIAMYRLHRAGQEWVYMPDLRSRGQDEVIARHWFLIEKDEELQREDGSTRTGWWRLTATGTRFVRGELLIPKYARVYNGRRLGYDDTELVSIRDCLGTRFNYDELMAGL